MKVIVLHSTRISTKTRHQIPHLTIVKRHQRLAKLHLGPSRHRGCIFLGKTMRQFVAGENRGRSNKLKTNDRPGNNSKELPVATVFLSNLRPTHSSTVVSVSEFHEMG